MKPTPLGITISNRHRAVSTDEDQMARSLIALRQYDEDARGRGARRAVGKAMGQSHANIIKGILARRPDLADLVPDDLAHWI